MGGGSKVKKVIEREYKGKVLRKIWERRHKVEFGETYDDLLSISTPLSVAVSFYILSGEHKNTKFPPKPVMLLNYGQYQMRLISDDAIDFIKFFESAAELAQEYADEMNDISNIEKSKYMKRMERENERINKQIRKRR